MEKSENGKILRLLEYIKRATSLRTKEYLSTDEYENVLWLSEIPRLKNCYFCGWEGSKGENNDVWIEVKKYNEPSFPEPPEECKGWFDEELLRDKSDYPELFQERVVVDKNEGVPFKNKIYLRDYPDVKERWNRYLIDKWKPWALSHDDWESVFTVYKKLFKIRQFLQKEGENYEVILGFGLLKWKTPSNRTIKRHILVSGVSLEFDSERGIFLVGPPENGVELKMETHMLNMEDLPKNYKNEAKKAFKKIGGDIWNRELMDEVFRKFIHSIDPLGEYFPTLKERKEPPSSKPVIEYSPALILRKRSIRSFTEAIDTIKARIESGEEVPILLRQLSEMGDRKDAVSTLSVESERDINLKDGKIFFPLPSNMEQRKIIERLLNNNGVQVQGPPGTGKSHTIANIISHFLATGKKMLITAKTPRALKVLEGLLPEDLIPLCVSLLGNSREEKKSLEISINGILRKSEDWDKEEVKEKISELEKKLETLRKEKIRLDRKVLLTNKMEFEKYIINKYYAGKPTKIISNVRKDEKIFGWFRDEVKGVFPFNVELFHFLLVNLRKFDEKKQRELRYNIPETLPDIEFFKRIFEREEESSKREKSLKEVGDIRRMMDFVGENVPCESIENFKKSLERLLEECIKFDGFSYKWVSNVMWDVVYGHFEYWKNLSRKTHAIIDLLNSLIGKYDYENTVVKIEEKIDLNLLYKDVLKIKEHLENGGKIGWWIFRPSTVRKRKYVFEKVYINGHPPSNLEEFLFLSDFLNLELNLRRLWSLWSNVLEPVQGTFLIQLDKAKLFLNILDDILSFRENVIHCRKWAKECGISFNLMWNSKDEIEKLIALCELSLCLKEKREIEKSLEEVKDKLISLANPHPIVNALLKSIEKRDLNGVGRNLIKIAELKRDKKLLEKVEGSLKEVKKRLPELSSELRSTFMEDYWEERFSKIEMAWYWAEARDWVKKYVEKDNLHGVMQKLKDVEYEIGRTIAKLASLKAWSICMSNLSEKEKKHMQAWKLSMNQIKKSSKYNVKYRRDAQEHLKKCRSAVPAWVMPLYRVWDTIKPSPNMFDLIIVDEASQCGIEAVPLFYLGKKILIVGDDKQISPEPVGIFKSTVYRFMEELLEDLELRSIFDIERSLFDIGGVLFNSSKVTLREHFRCMPEIIFFSNKHFYFDTPLIPLRQYGKDRLTPLQHFFVEDGFREGNGQGVINRPEARAIVKKISELCKDEKYRDKTMGVIVLQGHAQGKLIENFLIDEIGPEEMEKRRIICGNPYSFQGDERDVIFLSLVAAPNERIKAFTTSQDERRFNVAASRARDQMWLFYSVRLEELNPDDLRRKLIEFFIYQEPILHRGLKWQELEKKAKISNRSVEKPPEPFDSWFEVDVALEILRRGYSVIPQFKVGSKRIDLVVEGGSYKLAVECDGDFWHGEEKFLEDFKRQRQLERCGWKFFRIRSSAFYADREISLYPLWNLLETMMIYPLNIHSSA